MIAEVAIVIEFDAPSELVAEDLGNLEVWFDVGPKDLFEVLLPSKKLDIISLAVIQLAGGKIEVNHEVHWIRSTL